MDGVSYATAPVLDAKARAKALDDTSHLPPNGSIIGRAALQKTAAPATPPPPVAAAPPPTTPPSVAAAPVAPQAVLPTPTYPVPVTPQPQEQPAPKPAKQRVVMTGGGLGKITLFLRRVAISDSLILLFYPNDGESSIVEPPEAGIDNPILITYNGTTYDCISGNWSAEVGDELVVALPRIIREDGP